MSPASTRSIAAFYEWFLAPLGAAPLLPELCNTRDQLNARLSGLSSDSSLAGLSDGDSAYLVSVAGEIGNNCFDHNLGKWEDSTGGILAWGSHQQLFWCVITDRGQGLLGSLARVAPEIRTSQEALDIAFTKRITGRAPEKRGNGLKFVREIINEQEGRALFFQTNGAIHTFGSLGQNIYPLLGRPTRAAEGPAGTFALILWSH